MPSPEEIDTWVHFARVQREYYADKNVWNTESHNAVMRAILSVPPGELIKPNKLAPRAMLVYL